MQQHTARPFSQSFKLHLSRWLLLFTLSLFATLPASAQQPESMVDSLLQAYMDKSKTPGLSVAVGRDGEILWSKGYGYADLESMVPVNPALTRFRVGSVAKPIVATALAQLSEAGRLELDAPVQRYVPSFPEKPEGVITPRLLAGHLGGIRHYLDEEENYNLTHYDDVTSALVEFADDPLVQVPGTAYSYSSYGYNLLSVVIENAAGESFLEYMQHAVFDPMGMSQTTADNIYTIIEYRARPYMLYGGQVLINARAADNSYKLAGGGLLSTSEDLVRFGIGMLDPEKVSDASRDLLWQPMQTSSGKSTGYGMGWNSVTNGEGERLVYHTGSSVGGTSYFGINRDTGVIVALTMNISGAAPPQEEVQALFTIFKGENQP